MVTVTGKVVNSRGEPIENATVVLPLSHLFALSGEDGEFIITDVFPGIHTIYAIQRYYAKFESDVNLSVDTFVTIELDRL